MKIQTQHQKKKVEERGRKNKKSVTFTGLVPPLVIPEGSVVVQQ